MNHEKLLILFQQMGIQEEDTSFLGGRDCYPISKEPLDNPVAKHLITGPPTEDLQRALDATTDR
jgi:hypothetical protein